MIHRLLLAALLALGLTAGPATAQNPFGVPTLTVPSLENSRIAIMIGDSSIANAGTGNLDNGICDGSTTSCACAIDGSALCWSGLYSGQRVYLAPGSGANYGHTGDKSADVLARMAAPLAAHADLALVGILENDGNNNIDYATAVANDRAIVGQFLRAGTTVIEMGGWPRCGSAAYTTAQAGLVQQYDVARQRFMESSTAKGYYFVPVSSVMVDPATPATYTAIAANMSADCVHYSKIGGSAVGWLIAQQINAIRPQWRVAPYTNADFYDATNCPTCNLLTSGILTGTGGTVGPTCSGTGPDNTTTRSIGADAGGAACTVSVSTGSDGRPIVTITVSGTYTGSNLGVEIFQLAPTPSTNASAGDVLEATCWTNVGASTNVSDLDCAMQTTESGTNYTMHGMNGNSAKPSMPAAGWACGVDCVVPILTPRRTLTAAPTKIALTQFIHFTNGSSQTIAATVKLTGMTVRKVTQ